MNFCNSVSCLLIKFPMCAKLGHFARQAQFELMISFMEQHGDIQCKPSGLTTQGRLENLQKWTELTELLNDKSLGDPKTIDKWRKCWSDFKNNTKKKARRIKNNTVRAHLTDLERRLLLLVKDNKNFNRKPPESDGEAEAEPLADPDADNVIMLKEEIQPDQYDRTSSPTPQYFCEASGEARRRRKSSASSYSSTSSDSKSTSPKRKKRFKGGMKDMTEKYLEFEREREKMAHEREMARIQQNDKLVTIFGRIVNVLETLAPSLQKFLERNTSDDG